jgi:hypothetical protein
MATGLLEYLLPGSSVDQLAAGRSSVEEKTGHSSLRLTTRQPVPGEAVGGRDCGLP